jgi:hypothetical protein
MTGNVVPGAPEPLLPLPNAHNFTKGTAAEIGWGQTDPGKVASNELKKVKWGIERDELTRAADAAAEAVDPSQVGMWKGLTTDDGLARKAMRLTDQGILKQAGHRFNGIGELMALGSGHASIWAPLKGLRTFGAGATAYGADAARAALNSTAAQNPGLRALVAGELGDLTTQWLQDRPAR